MSLPNQKELPWIDATNVWWESELTFCPDSCMLFSELHFILKELYLKCINHPVLLAPGIGLVHAQHGLAFQSWNETQTAKRIICRRQSWSQSWRTTWLGLEEDNSKGTFLKRHVWEGLKSTTSINMSYGTVHLGQVWLLSFVCSSLRSRIWMPWLPTLHSKWDIEL